MNRPWITCVVALIWLSAGLPSVFCQTQISFNRDVRPILASKCFACHGPDDQERQSDLRLDDRRSAVGLGAIVPGQPDQSSLVERVFSDDEDSVMPPADFDKRLTADEKLTLKRWIAEGGAYEVHWAFVPPVRPDLPKVKDAGWVRNPIDRFVLDQLDRLQRRPAATADRATLVRRLYLDLVGLPPTPAEADAFVNSTAPDAYERLVDHLLESPGYGERWAKPWLDLARYSDTNGYEKDRPRSIWAYRDWVIRALNEDMPYDQFTIEQLAGDMLPDPRAAQIIATGFHRNSMLNEEGGIDPLEYRYLAMVDRVATTGAVWLGLTVGCAQCHNHKYDPISQTDYFQLMALMNNADEPDFEIPDRQKQQRRQQLEGRIRKLERELVERFPRGGQAEQADKADKADKAEHQKIQLEFADWREQSAAQSFAWQSIVPYRWKTNLPSLEVLDDDSILSTGDITKRDRFELTFALPPRSGEIRAIKLEALPDSRLPAKGPGRTYYEGRKGDFFLSEIEMEVDGEAVTFADASHSFGNPEEKNPKLKSTNVFDGDGSTGWMPGSRKGERLQLVLNLKTPILTQPDGPADEIKVTLLFERHYAASLGRFRFSISSDPGAVATEFPADIEQALARYRHRGQLNNPDRLYRYFLNTTPLLADARQPIEALRRQIPVPDHTMVFQERPESNPRKTFRHHRGEYLSPREPVEPGIIGLFAEATPDVQLPKDRLDLARWLVSEHNPLVARVAVNRAWREIFGFGLVRSSGDFGVQSSPPTHPGLLDWLAVEFTERDWSMKRLHRLIVNSATYRQSSAGSEALYAADPDNRWLARGPRFRVPAEMVRDIMLKSSGLISGKMYGPGVHPPQPASVTALAYGATRWSASQGEDRYRRSIYTFQKRTAPFAAYTVFDGPTGESCLVRRNRSNTPLQALTVLNDEMFLEMARALAQRTVRQEGLDTVAARAEHVFRRVLTRKPTADELDSLVKYFQAQILRLDSGELSAAEIVADPKASTEWAAWTMVARVVMNLDESITKQ